MQNKWEGRISTNANLLSFSLAAKILKNEHSFMTGKNMISLLVNDLFIEDKNQLIHGYGLTSWKYSMKFRLFIESSIAFILTIVF